jgi:arabinose-5-phosphate isomerase
MEATPKKKTTPPLAPSVLQEFAQVLRLESEAIQKACARIESDPKSGHPVIQSLELILECLDRGGKVVVIGLGKSGKIAQKISATLASTGSPSVFIHPTEALHGDLGTISTADVVLALSHTGNTEEILKVCQSVRSQQIPVIGLGGNPQSQLAQLSSVWLDASVESEACPHNLAPTSSTTLALALGDALAVTLMKHRGFDAQAFAKNHPGGSLGRRLQLKVREVMHDASKLPLLSKDASMEQVIEASSRQNLGAVLIVDADRQLLGIITDGDLRRALKHRDRFFGLRAHEVMTAKPITIDADSLAYSALERMENRPSQIKELPVVDSKNRVEGLVRIHDLLKFF